MSRGSIHSDFRSIAPMIVTSRSCGGHEASTCRSHGASGDRLAVHAQARMIEPRVIEHVGNEVVDLLHVITHGAQLPMQAFVDFAFEHGDGETHARQRRAHLVRQRRGHLFLALDELADARGHVIEVARQAPELGDAVRGVERLAIVGGELLRCVGEHAQIASAAAAATGRRSAGWTRRKTPAGGAPAHPSRGGIEGTQTDARRPAPAECHR